MILLWLIMAFCGHKLWAKLLQCCNLVQNAIVICFLQQSFHFETYFCLYKCVNCFYFLPTDKYS